MNVDGGLVAVALSNVLTYATVLSTVTQCI